MSKKLVSLISTETVVTCHGLRSISSLLKKHGHNTRLIFLSTLKRRYSHRILNELRDLVADSDLIGISCYSQTSEKAIQVIGLLKNLKVPIMWGGCHATLNPEICIRLADFVCIGEGEGACLDLVERLHDKDTIKETPNLWVKTNGEIYKNKPRPLISNIDELPWEDYDFTNQYFLEKGVRLSKYRGERIGAQSYRPILVKEKRKGFSVLLSRGCPFSCSYCYNYDFRLLYSGISNNTLRRKSILAAITELYYYKEKLQLNEKNSFISFDDDEFFSRPITEIEQFCSEYREKIKIPFGCHVHTRSFKEEKLKLLIDTGLWIVTVGIQTGSDRINREIYKRNIAQTEVLVVAKTLHKYSQHFYFLPSYHVINTNPYEKEKDVWETINLITSFPKPFNIQVFQLSFFPNSWLTKKALTDGVLSNAKELAFDEHYYDAISYAIRRKKYCYAWFVLNLLVGLHKSSQMGSVSLLAFRILVNKKIRHFFEKHVFLARLLTYLLLFNHKYQYRRYALPYFIRQYYYYRYNY